MTAAKSAPARAFVAFGANLGDPVAAFKNAMVALESLPDTCINAHSELYRTAPVGTGPQPDYLNAVVELGTTLPPSDLLEWLLTIEREAGRTREAAQAPRTLDLDLLLYDEKVIDMPGLQIPHPRMHERAFVLVPLSEIAPDAVIPGHGPVVALLPHVADQSITRLAHA